MYNPFLISNYFITKSLEDSIEISPMKLNKLVYIAHGWYLALENQALIDQNPEAWRYGPVIPSIYHQYKHLRNNPVKNPVAVSGQLKPATTVFLNRIWEVYKDFSAIQLSTKTHQVDTPWHNTWNSVINAEYMSLQIPDMQIKNHYLAKVNANKAGSEE